MTKTHRCIRTRVHTFSAQIMRGAMSLQGPHLHIRLVAFKTQAYLPSHPRARDHTPAQSIMQAGLVVLGIKPRHPIFMLQMVTLGVTANPDH